MGAEAANPAEEISGVERLFRLLLLFASGGQVRASEIERRCGYVDIHGEQSSGRRVFHKDRHRVEALGVTIRRLHPEDPSDDRWVADRNQRFPVPLDDVELDALVAAGLLLDGAVLPDPGAAGAGAGTGRPRLRTGSGHGTGSTDGTAAGVPGNVVALQLAVQQRHAVRFTYNGSPRLLLPGRVFAEGPLWYFEGEEPDFLELKKFRVDRIEGGVTTDPTITAVASATGGPAHPCHWNVHEPVEVVVRFDGTPTAEWCNTLGLIEGYATIEPPGPDGSVVARGRVTNSPVFLDRLLVVGPEVVLESPASLRAQLCDLAQAHLDAWGA